MIVLYYEISRGRETPVYYRRVKNPHFKDAPGPFSLVYRANRIWEWDVEVDPKEFLMIQLAAQEYRDETG
jgi:hypothetical protein